MAMNAPLDPAQVADFRAALAGGAVPQDPAELIALIAEFESLKSAACAMQAEASRAYDAARRRAEAAAGVPAARQGRGVASEIALARRESPHRGQVLLGFAKVACAEMPHMMTRLAEGSLSEFRAMLSLRETACLSAEHRALVDEEVFADPAALDGVGTRRLVGQVKRLACELDPKSVVERASNATRDRHVSIRPAPDTMVWLGALLPVAQGVAVHAALTKGAASMAAAGDERSRSQLMADLFVSRVTGAPMSSGTTPPAVPVGINLLLPAASLVGGHDAALIDGEPLPAELARLLVAASLDSGLDTWLRKVFTDRSGAVVAMTSKQRTFPEGLAELLKIRDQGICRTPYCDAPIRHLDHVTPHADGGATSSANGQGVCEACNHAKQAPDWRQHVQVDGGIETVTPTGHRYLSRAPAPPGWREPRFVRTHPGVFELVA